MNKLKHIKRTKKVFEQVNKLYESSAMPAAHWFWHKHIPWVSSKAQSLAIKYQANDELVIAAVLLHDLADAHYPTRDHKSFDLWSESKGIEILLNSGFSDAETKEIIESIIRPHSCHKGKFPKTPEGKILATADAMYHLHTDFYLDVCWMHVPKGKTYEEFIVWAQEKIDRDFHYKIFFDDEKNEAKPRYNALRTLFFMEV